MSGLFESTIYFFLSLNIYGLCMETCKITVLICTLKVFQLQQNCVKVFDSQMWSRQRSHFTALVIVKVHNTCILELTLVIIRNTVCKIMFRDKSMSLLVILQELLCDIFSMKNGDNIKYKQYRISAVWFAYKPVLALWLAATRC